MCVCVCVCMPFSFPPSSALACRLPLFGLFPWRFTLWVREQPRTELRWGMALSDHHYTSPPFHLHLIILISPWGRVRAPVCLCTLCYHVLLWAYIYVRAGGKKKAKCGQRKRKMREGKGKERRVHMIQPLHLMQVPFAPYCLSHCWKKSRWFTKPEEAADPFSLGTALCVFVCLSVSVYMCAAHPFRQPWLCLCAMTHLWVWIVAVSP